MTGILKRYLRRKRDDSLLATRDVPWTLLDDDTPLPPAVAEVIPDGSGRWPLSPDLARLLHRVIRATDRRAVLEFGAGTSSLIIARSLQSMAGGRLTSIEQSPEWCEGVWKSVETIAEVDAHMIVSRPAPMVTSCGVLWGYASAREAVDARAPYDLVVIDAPQWFYGRDGAIPLIRHCLRDGAILILDDAGREMEQWTLFRWLRTHARSLRLLAFDAGFGGRGVAILEYRGPSRGRFDLLSFVTGTIHAGRLALARVRRRRS